MTLHCNLVKLWPCPEHIAKMCMHELEQYPYPDEDCIEPIPDTHYKWALERYLMWAEGTSDIDANVGRVKKLEFVLAVKAIVNNPDLKVWIE